MVVIWSHLAIKKSQLHATATSALACVFTWPLLGARWAPSGRRWPSFGVSWQSKSRRCAQLRVLPWHASFSGLSWAFAARLLGVIWVSFGNPKVAVAHDCDFCRGQCRSLASLGRPAGAIWASMAVAWAPCGRPFGVPLASVAKGSRK